MTSIDKRPHPGDLLSLAFELINARGSEYDNVSNMDQNFREAAAVASVVTGKSLTARDVVLVMACIKLIRSKSSPDKLDNYVDAMNYMAFAACFQGLTPMVLPTTPVPVVVKQAAE
jgi:hypothetical protein